MKKIACEVCGSEALVKRGGVFVCEYCGVKYSLEDAKQLFGERPENTETVAQTDNTALIQKLMGYARRAHHKEDWEYVAKFYGRVEQYEPDNMEAVFFSAYSKAMLSLSSPDFYKRAQRFKVLNNSISDLHDCFEKTTENKQEILSKIVDVVLNINNAPCMINEEAAGGVGSREWQDGLFNGAKEAMKNEVAKISEAHNDKYLKELWKKFLPPKKDPCYVATAVYGSYNCPEVWTLRRFRDHRLAKTRSGRAFIAVYYTISPALVKWFGKTAWFKKMWRRPLDRMVAKLQEKGYEATPYQDQPWR